MAATEAVKDVSNSALEFFVINRMNEGIMPVIDEFQPRSIILPGVTDINVSSAN
jgi:hypothetical protein